MTTPPTRDDDDALEAHRAIARELNARVANAYGLGGAFALLAAGGVLAAGWLAGQLWTALPWVASAMSFLVALFFARGAIRRAELRHRARLERYCEANDLAIDALLDYYDARGDYPFFAALRADDARARGELSSQDEVTET